MNLTFKNYTAEEENGRFNLYKAEMVTAAKDSDTRKKGEKYEVNKVIGYSYTFESMLKRMATDMTAQKDITTIREYIDEFKKVLEKIENALV